LHEGVNPDLEIGRFITEKTSYEHTPPLAGSLEYRKSTNAIANRDQIVHGT